MNLVEITKVMTATDLCEDIFEWLDRLVGEFIEQDYEVETCVLYKKVCDMIFKEFANEGIAFSDVTFGAKNIMWLIPEYDSPETAVKKYCSFVVQYQVPGRITSEFKIYIAHSRLPVFHGAVITKKAVYNFPVLFKMLINENIKDLEKDPVFDVVELKFKEITKSLQGWLTP